MQVQFSKMQCMGNDYIVVETFSQHFYDPATAALMLTDRKFGIGADALLVVSPSEIADAKLEVYNAEGETHDVSGCASRCAYKLLKDQGLCNKEKMMIETANTVVMTSQVGGGSKSISVTEELRKPDLLPEIKAEVEISGEKKELVLHPVCRLNHFYAVILAQENFPESEGIEKLNLAAIAAGVRKLPQYQEIAVVLTEPMAEGKQLKMRMWVPGTGEVRANANGAMAALRVAAEQNLCPKGEDVAVLLQGGTMILNQEVNIKHTGEVTSVLDGITA